ncbi:MAG: hypothetical protein JO115_10990 [Pseudonocardiales bacterium]|nr:hypothetical protein [Pseudonocardiales bacterium]
MTTRSAGPRYRVLVVHRVVPLRREHAGPPRRRAVISRGDIPALPLLRRSTSGVG